MYTRKGPYPDVPINEVCRRVVEGDLRPRVPPWCLFAGLVEQCARLCDERPSFAELLTALEGPAIGQLAAQAGLSLPTDLSVYLSAVAAEREGDVSRQSGLDAGDVVVITATLGESLSSSVASRMKQADAASGPLDSSRRSDAKHELAMVHP